MPTQRGKCAAQFTKAFGHAFGSDIAFVLEATGIRVWFRCPPLTTENRKSLRVKEEKIYPSFECVAPLQVQSILLALQRT